MVTHKARAATVSANAEDVRVACEYHKYPGYKYLWRNIAFTCQIHLYTKTLILVLDVNAFERLLGPCMDVMKDRVDDYEDQLIRIFGSKANISDIR